MIKYYKILDKNLVAKIDDFVPYLYENGKWTIDNNRILMDRLVGYDESESNKSSYKLGSSDMLERIVPITEEEALSLI